MVFLMHFDRGANRIVSLKTYDNSDYAAAEDDRLALDLELLRQGIEHEVVLLEAEDEAALRKTHGRYFYTARELLDALLDSISKS